MPRKGILEFLQIKSTKYLVFIFIYFVTSRQMVSLGVCSLSTINKILHSPQNNFIHSLNLPLPRVLHQQVDSDFLKNFDEVLVIGDVHGCYDELIMLLEHADASKDSTLKIYVGDLVDKGPKNNDVLDLLRRSPSMLSVRGNHDEKVLMEYLNSLNKDYKLKPSNLWMKDLSPENADYLTELPYTINIPSLNAVVVHAGLLNGTRLESNSPYDMVHMRNIVQISSFWNGGLLATEDGSKGNCWASFWNGPQHVYFGHDAKRMLQTYPFATGLDTGCVYGYWLTGVFISGPRKGSYVKVQALKVHAIPKG